jgi:NitT/TauT family transport system ATP-binding protein
MTVTELAPAAVGKVELRGVTKTFVDAKRGRQTVALQDVTLSIPDRQFVCLLGPSGCGKSTVLNLVAGFEPPSAGEVVVGARATGHSANGAVAGYGMVFQQPHLFPWLTVVENITFGPRLTGTPASEYGPRARRYIELMGLRGFEQYYPYELSGGMQQRVALARAWIKEPSLFLMDEPFAALDAQTRLLMQELLLKVWESSRSTVLFVTHDIDEAIFLSDRIVVLAARPGRVSEDVLVPLPRPRDYASVIFEPAYVDLKKHILDLIRRETMRGMAGEGPTAPDER